MPDRGVRLHWFGDGVTAAILFLDAAVLVIVALLGNEFRLIIDEAFDDRAPRDGRHDAGTVPITLPAYRLSGMRREQDRALFDRIATDFMLTEMNQQTKRFAAVERSDVE